MNKFCCSCLRHLPIKSLSLKLLLADFFANYFNAVGINPSRSYYVFKNYFYVFVSQVPMELGECC